MIINTLPTGNNVNIVVMEVCNVSIWCEHYDDGNMLTLIVMVMMENDCHDYQPLPMSTLLLMEIRASLVHNHVDVDITMSIWCEHYDDEIC